MPTLADDYAAYQTAVANVAPLQSAADSAAAALAAGQALVTPAGAQVAADVVAGPGYVGPDASGNITVIAAAPSSSPAFSATVIPPASSITSAGSSS